MSRLETQIAQAITEYLDSELHSAVQDQVCISDIANEIDLDDVVSHLDVDYKFDQAIADWMENNFDTIADQYRHTAEYVVKGKAESYMEAWLKARSHRFEPLHRRCWRWLKSINWKFWRKKNEA
mgnify:CR=1 FL=1